MWGSLSTREPPSASSPARAPGEQRNADGRASGQTGGITVQAGGRGRNTQTFLSPLKVEKLQSGISLECGNINIL